MSQARKSGFVAIAGRPNSGKSTLLNRILRMKLSIVSSKAQTTRERVLGVLTEDRGQIVFVDTPGIHRAREGGINAFMMSEVSAAIEGTSVVWYLVDPFSKLEHEVRALDLLAEQKVPVLILLSKADLKTPAGASLLSQVQEAALQRGMDIRGAFEISAKSGAGLDLLLGQTWELLSEGPIYYPDEDQVSDRPSRFFVAERIREQLFRQLGEEVPYSCAVKIEKFDEKVRPVRIEAVIYVERESQKGILIGKGGQKIKAIGQAARLEVEQFLGYPVFLGLEIRLLKDWTREPGLLKQLGYVLPKKRRLHGGADDR